MSTLASAALNWIANLRPRWLWISIAILGAGFSVWTAIPDKYQTLLLDYAVEHACPNQPAVDLAIGDFRVPKDARNDLIWLKTKVERNLVELFVDNGRKTAHRLTVLAAGNGKHPTLSGEITKAGPGRVEISIQFAAQTGAIIASTSLVASLDFLKAHYKAIPDAIVYGLDIDFKSLVPLARKARPTESLTAYMLYVEARRAAAHGDLDGALAHLDAAVELDPNFASAHGAAAEVLRALHRPEEADKRVAQADSINLDRPTLSVLSGVAKPLPDVLTAVRAQPWQQLGAGLSEKRVNVDSYGISLFAWRLDPGRYRMRVAIQSDPHGSTVSDLRLAQRATLAVNGGFFDIDREGRLTAAGYLSSKGRHVAPYRDGAGSAVLYQQGDSIDIAASKDTDVYARASDAVQAGPMVVDPGGRNGIYRNDFNRHDRTSVCISGTDIVVVVVKGGLSLYELGALLSAPEKDGGFTCDRAINLDGGPSTQASLALERQSIEIEATWRSHSAVVFEHK